MFVGSTAQRLMKPTSNIWIGSREIAKKLLKIFFTSAIRFKLLAIWAFSHAVAFALNLSLQIIREDYHIINIVFQVVFVFIFSFVSDRLRGFTLNLNQSINFSGLHPGKLSHLLLLHYQVHVYRKFI